MYEKISEIPVREEKVKKLKKKILKEIEREIERCKQDLIYDLTVEMYNEEFENTIKIMHGLYELQKYVNCNYFFMCNTYEDHVNDIIIYEVSMKNIDIFLQDDYTFINHLIFQIEDGLIVENNLNDYYFGYQYLSIFDSVLYDKKLEETNNETSI